MYFINKSSILEVINLWPDNRIGKKAFKFQNAKNIKRVFFGLIKIWSIVKTRVPVWDTRIDLVRRLSLAITPLTRSLNSVKNTLNIRLKLKCFILINFNRSKIDVWREGWLRSYVPARPNDHQQIHRSAMYRFYIDEISMRPVRRMDYSTGKYTRYQFFIVVKFIISFS